MTLSAGVDWQRLALSNVDARQLGQPSGNEWHLRFAHRRAHQGARVAYLQVDGFSQVNIGERAAVEANAFDLAARKGDDTQL